MKVVTVVLLGMFILVCYEKPGKMATSSNEVSMGDSRTAQLPPSLGGVPVQWFPQKEQFVTRENDPFLVLVTIDCLGSPNDARFELLQPTPGFVKLIPLCSAPTSRFAQTLVVIGPTNGDAGKYEVRVAGTRCGHPDEPVGQPLLRLFVRVKVAA